MLQVGIQQLIFGISPFDIAPAYAGAMHFRTTETTVNSLQ
jgi:hypothetical protein